MVGKRHGRFFIIDGEARLAACFGSAVVAIETTPIRHIHGKMVIFAVKSFVQGIYIVFSHGSLEHANKNQCHITTIIHGELITNVTKESFQNGGYCCMRTGWQK